MKKIFIDEKLYPKKLKEISAPPSVLYTEGNLELLKKYSIAIIGSRQASDNGKKLTEKFSSELSSCGITIVSGLARGIDTIAHTYSYNQKGKTIAVLGSGFNKIFPPENIDLYKKILEEDGLVVSEYPPNTEADSLKFPERNRIISGLSNGIIVIEAKSRSGTSITAKFAKEQHKPVFVLPHEIDSPHGIGTNRLLKKGAIPITDTADVLDKLKLTEFKEIYKKNKKSNNLNKRNYNFSDSKQKLIFNLISKEPISPNDLSRKSGYSVNEILSILFILEMNGYIKKVQGGYVCM